ncbi:C39 family peptidase [Erythrobacter rubeus]|uniref:C39 family peptidase n=1 Tax=Erythrobacter rubeus TaxID=2760803 RepID=A0ABR8KV55_9SPHN|nr:C39 family peptidase [Erythrobacter rubeus]MBD2842127.1 C39 family peptidase [Erythrobacter rubeus]
MRTVCLPLISIGMLCSLAGCASAPGGIQPFAVGQEGLRAQPLYKPVSSWRTRKFTNLVRQQTDFSCGAAALATIFNYAYGKNTSEQQVLVNMLKIADPDVIREKGFSLLDMKNYVLAVGMTGQGYEVEYDALKNLKVPAIALLDIKNYKHFVVVKKVRDDFVQIGDPALGNRTMSRRDFLKSWNNVVFVIVGDGFDPDTVLLNPPPPLSAARLYGLRSPVRNAEIYDQGLGPAFNFVF